jgi:beta-lactamase class A
VRLAGLPEAVDAAAAADRDVSWRVVVLDAATGAVLAQRDPDTVQRTASLGKLLLLIEVARRLEDGSLDPAEPLTPTDEDLVRDSGLWWHLTARSLPLADCAALVGAFSDNLATNVLLGRVGGPGPVRATAQAATLDGVRLHRKVRDTAPPPGTGNPHGLSSGSARAYADLVARLHRLDVISPSVCARVLGWLGLNADLSMVGGAFGLDPLCHNEPDRGVQLWNKTGTIDDVLADVGLVSGPGAVVSYAVLTEHDDAHHPGGRDSTLAGMARVGAAVRAVVEGR